MLVSPHARLATKARSCSENRSLDYETARDKKLLSNWKGGAEMGRHEAKGARFRFGGGIGIRGRLLGGGDGYIGFWGWV